MSEKLKATDLRNQAWHAFNSAHFETGIVAEASRELGQILLSQADTASHRQKKETLFAKLDAQNRLIDTAITLRRGVSVSLSPAQTA